MSRVRGGVANRNESEKKRVQESVKGLSLEQVVSQLGQVQLQVQTGLANLNTILSDRVAQLNDVETAISLKQDELKTLIEIEKNVEDLEKLEAEIQQTKKNWEEERKEHFKTKNETLAQTEAECERKNQEWEYEFERRKKMKEDELNDITTQREKGWNEREAYLKSQETDLARLKQLEQEYPEKIRKETSKEVAIAEARLRRDFEQQMQLLNKDIEGERKLIAQKEESYKNQILELNNQLSSLKTQLLTAQQDAKDIAKAALAASSDKDVAEALKKVVGNQGNSGQGQKRA